MAAFSTSIQSKGVSVALHLLATPSRPNLCLPVKFKCPTRNFRNQRSQNSRFAVSCLLGATVPNVELPLSSATISVDPITDLSNAVTEPVHSLVVMDLDPATAKLAITFVAPLLSVFSFLFIVRIIMSWYPKLPVGKFPYVLAFVPTEPILMLTRKVIPPLGGVDITPVVWFGIIRLLDEILVGSQGLLVMLSKR